MPSATSKIAQRMAAVKQAQKTTLADMAALARKAGKKHDAIIGKLNGLGDDHPARPALEEARDGLRAASDFCRSTIEQQTGQAPQDPNYHGSRDEGGKFTRTDSPGHMMRRMQGKP